MGSGALPLYLHVGLPKSGTTYLQAVLARHRPDLRATGVVYPYAGRESMFRAAVEVRGQHARWGFPVDGPRGVQGTFARLLRDARKASVAAVISHELYAGATPQQVAAIVAATDAFELHVVVTMRDLARQAVAYWQEQVKNGRSWSFEEFEHRVLDRFLAGEDGSTTLAEEREARLLRGGAGGYTVGDGRGFWRAQDLDSVLDRWRVAVPPERLHLVTVPPAGASPSVLWERFASVVGLDPSSVRVDEVPRTNSSLGVGQIALLRRVNEALDGRIGQPHYSHVVKRGFAQTQLAAIGGRRPEVPLHVAEALDAVVDRWVARIEAEGYDVVGDLADLSSSSGIAAVGSPDDVTDAEMLQGLPAVLADLLEQIAVLRSQGPGEDTLPAVPQEPGRAAAL
ncbi:sulfotransferase [Nocardioides sp. GY 10127]|uniref:sulfotransferase n=1 Tax=Nocardioides sp. GY 10127 TaxID=2569762 RepID=UPI0010A811BC|nr:sulfotransferase [Nocardioides sp. GY 10127]TIC80831.1 sulfotransferase [Nocardioides sp. GY 10127]